MVHLEQQNKKNDVYQRITEAIIASIEQNAGTYQMPWHRSGNMFGRPKNAFSGRYYSGVNVLALWATGQSKHYCSELWATYKQWNCLSAQVRKGEKGSPIVFFKQIPPQEESDGTQEKSKHSFYAQTSWVFNADQVENFSVPKPEARGLVERLEAAEMTVNSTKADIRHGGEQAFYDRRGDYIRVPEKENFIGSSTSTPTESYYSVLFHELTHWTGHEKRLTRDLGGRFGEQSYAMEELVAELGAAFLCSDLGVSNSPRQDHASYMSKWLQVLRSDTRAVFTAASKAAEAADYVMRYPDSRERKN